MVRRHHLLPFLVAAASICAPLSSITPASAFVPPDGADPIENPQATGGSPGVAQPPPQVFLNRSVYYVGEVITGQVTCPDCFPTGPIFFDSMDAQITGTIVYSELVYGSFVFIPDAPLPVGSYYAQLDTYSTAYFEVIDAESVPPTYEVALSESHNPIGDPIECQSTVPGYAGGVYPQSRIDAALGIAVVGDSADQYQYEFSLDGGQRTSLNIAFPLATFRQGDGEFCVEVFAIPYTESPEFSLGTVCLNPDAELELGVRDIPYGSLDSVLAICELPPDGYMEEWCAYHSEAFTRHSCAGFIEEACLQARYECPDGDLPEWFDENGIDPDATGGSGGTGIGGTGTGAMGSGAAGTGGGDVIDQEERAESDDDDMSTDESGCSCTTGVSKSFGAGNRTFLLVLMGGALIALRRRERKFLQ